MTLEEALRLQPVWVQLWLYVLLAGAFVLPLTLLIWRQTRMAAVLAVAASVLAGVGVGWMYDRMGYVKLLGLPHILFWTPLAIYLVALARRPDMPDWPRRILWAVAATILISLAFDYTDAVRWLLGERTPVPGTEPA
ncbi:MAG: hypothetical protein KDK24_17435 [Pseudooceanicola sp.]|nr:hypothetical protein [Pseudooceanicola sp.]